nr:hypothetical protein [Ophiocordyceps lanpingensis]
MRLWYPCGNGLTKSNYYPGVIPATELGKREILELNIASLYEGKSGWNRMNPITYRADPHMNKAILLEFHLPGASSYGPHLVRDRMCIMNIVLIWRTLFWIIINRNRISIHNVESGNSKWGNNPAWGTKGLPVAPKSYGSRGTVVTSLMWREPGTKYRSLLTPVGSPRTVSTDAVGKLRKIAKLCEENPNFVVTDKLYRLLFDNNLYQIAYDRLKSKPGNMTPGIIPTTLDGMSIEVVENMIKELRSGSFKFKPGRRVLIPKGNGKTRPLTIAPPRDKLVQECIKMILETIYEPSFSDCSHGFRPGRSCHSALKMVNQKFRMASWIIEGDITKCFDLVNHNILIEFLQERIKDERFIRIIRKSLNAGYFEFKTFSQSLVGTPQGSIISPILANIYLDKLDQFVEELKVNFDKGFKSAVNPEWKKLENRSRKAETLQEKRAIRKEMLTLPSKLSINPNWKKLVYVRYADDWMIGIKGSRSDCIDIMNKVRQFLKNKLELELSEEKTLISNVNNDHVTFLSTRIKRFQKVSFRRINGKLTRNVKGLRFMAPIDRIVKKLQTNGFLVNNMPAPRFLWLQCCKDEIILLYNSVYRGITNYYRFTHNFNELSSRVHYILKSSCAKLLAAKFTLKNQAHVFKKFGKELVGSDKHKFVKALYGIKPSAFKKETGDVQLRITAPGISKATLENLACSVCSSEYRVEMHHVRMMKDLNPKARYVDKIMAKRNRKQIPLCRNCHLKHHKGLL